ncbi:hypothetical protein [Gemmiger sp.]
MKDEKVKINMRVGQRLREVLEGRAAVEDIRVGTLTNRLLQEELDKVLAVGVEHCVVEGEEEYEKHREEIAQHRERYYIFPSDAAVDDNMSTKEDNTVFPQISLYFTKEQYEIMSEIVLRRGAWKTVQNGRVKSYRYVIVGMLLNNPACRKLGAAGEQP